MYHKSNSLNIKKQYPKKWRQGPTDNTGTETPACLQKNHTRDKTNWRLKAATSQLLLHRNDRSRKVSTHMKIMEKIFTCLYASTNDIYVAVLTQGIFITLLLRKDQSQNAFRLEVYAVLATIIRMRHSLFKKVKLNTTCRIGWVNSTCNEVLSQEKYGSENNIWKVTERHQKKEFTWLGQEGKASLEQQYDLQKKQEVL